MFRTSGIETQSIADFGAQRVLGTPGSITGYINTGNPYDKGYYKKDLPVDKFEKKSSAKNTKKKKILLTGAVLALGAGAALLLGKKVKGGLEKLSGLKDKVKDLFSKIKIKK